MDKSISQKGIAAWRAFLEAHAIIIRALEREMEEEQGLPLTWYDILVHLDHAPQGRLRMQALAECLLLSRSGVTRLSRLRRYSMRLAVEGSARCRMPARTLARNRFAAP